MTLYFVGNKTQINVRATKLMAGSTFKGRIGTTEGTFLVGFKVIVRLEDPSATWNISDTLTIDELQYVDIEAKIVERKE